MALIGSVGATLSGIRFATKGGWENALVADNLSSRAVTDWLIASGADVGVECLFCCASGNCAGFIGFRPLIAHRHERCRIWLEILGRTRPLGSLGRWKNVALWLHLPGEPSLLAAIPAKIALGVWNTWRPAGSLKLPAERSTKSDIHGGPASIWHGATAPVVRERQWRAPVEFWIGKVVSEEQEERYFPLRSMSPEWPAATRI